MRRRQDPFEKPWVIIAAVVGIIAVIVIALVFFMGGGSEAPAGSSGGSQVTSSNPSQPSGQQTLSPGTTISANKTRTPVAVPTEGVYVRVSYLGSFSGEYGMEGNMTSMRNSGDRVFVVENATGTVSATFHKEDASTRHELVVEILRDGKSLQSARNTSSFGVASATATV